MSTPKIYITRRKIQYRYTPTAVWTAKPVLFQFFRWHTAEIGLNNYTVREKFMMLTHVLKGFVFVGDIDSITSSSLFTLLGKCGLCDFP